MTKTSSDIKFLCPYPWTHYCASFLNETRVCCHSNYIIGKDFNKSVADIRNSDFFTDIRSKMLDNKIPDECLSCHTLERRGIISERIKANNRFSSVVSKITSSLSTKSLPLESIDIRFSNTCNFSCLMCNEEISTRWGAEKGIDSKRMLSQAEEDELLKNTSSLSSIYIAGGEPLHESRVDKFLNAIPDYDASHITLALDTNLSTSNERLHHFIKTFSRFKSTSIGISIDAPGEIGQTIRKGLEWQSFERNIETLIEIGGKNKISFFATTTISALNILSYLQLIYYMNDRWNCRMAIVNNFLKLPKEISLPYLPKNLRKKIQGELRRSILLDEKTYRFKSNIAEVVSYLEIDPQTGGPWLLEKYLRTMCDSDRKSPLFENLLKVVREER